MIKKIFSKLYNCIHPKNVNEINNYQDVNDFVRFFKNRYYIGEGRSVFTFKDKNKDKIEITRINFFGPFIINGNLERYIKAYVWQESMVARGVVKVNLFFESAYKLQLMNLLLTEV
jgi:hypothetical protein